MKSRSTRSDEGGSPISEITSVRILILSLLLSAIRFSTASPVRPPQGFESTVLALGGKSNSTFNSTQNSSKCLNRFYTHAPQFDVCKKQVCFIFLREEPYIMLDNRMNGDADSVLFPCKTPRAKFSRLHGAAFSIMHMTDARESLCVWGGPKCLFNDMVDFIDRHSPEYMFAATGLLTETSGRRNKTNIIPSVSIVAEQLVIVGPSKGTNTNKNPLPIYNVLRPFTRAAWALFILTFIVITLFALSTAYVFGPRERTVRNFFYFFFCDYPKSAVADTTPSPSPAESKDSTVEEVEKMFLKRVAYRMSSYKVARLLLQLAVSFVVLTFLLFYEISVVHFLFIESKNPIVQNPKELSKEELERYSIEENAATENVWNGTVYETKKYGLEKKNYPWGRCSTNSECIDWALDKNKSVQLVVGFQTSLTYHILNRSACDRLTIYGTGKVKLYSFGAGWLFGSGIPEEFISNVNSQLSDVRIKKEIHRIIDEASGTLDTSECKTKIEDIDGGVMGACVLITAAPMLCALLVMIIYYVARMFPKMRTDEEFLRQVENDRRAKKKAQRHFVQPYIYV